MLEFRVEMIWLPICWIFSYLNPVISVAFA